ncbi:hypothetical protein CW705_01100 [Candidatus Bathyarchaeota archaeon]|nr:MAG: hypothetical protein CW705_01100 [Candidatus Bathyarchaeota archaeon]
MSEDEVSVTYQPIKEIVIMQKSRFNSPDDLARFASIISGGKPSGLYWAEGVLFLYFLLPSSTETAAKALVEEGKVYWTMVGYAIMEKYQPVIETREKIIVPVVDMSSNPSLRRAAEWLKNQEA